MAAPADTGNATATNVAYTDPNIVALLDEANKADSAAGAFALGKAADPGVKAFAKMMMGEHHALRFQGQALAKKLKVTPEPPTDDPVKSAGTAEMDSLRAAGKGAAFDKVYIDQEVAIHKAVLDLADRPTGIPRLLSSRP
jgi:putative membrane protein